MPEPFPPDEALDARLDDAERRGLTGATGAGAYEATRDPEDVSRAPDPADERRPPEWRQDFPIDWPKDEHVARREFARFLVLTSSAFVAGQGFIAAQHLLRQRRPAVPTRLKVASLSALPNGSATVFSYPDQHDKCLLVRLEDGSVVAFSQACTHLSCAVVPRLSEGVFFCPCHDGYFDLRTGRNISGPPPRPLPRILLETEGDDLYAVGVEHRTVG